MNDYEMNPEQILIRKACRGDVKAFSELYAGIYQDLYRFALFTLKHCEDAEDAVSDTVIAAYENIHKLKKETSFRSWMFTILVNQCKKRFRGEQWHADLTEETAGEAVEGDYAEQHDVREAFMQLEEADRMIISCSVLEGYTSEEIGGLLGMNPATVRSRKARALDQMRRILE